MPIGRRLGHFRSAAREFSPRPNGSSRVQVVVCSQDARCEGSAVALPRLPPVAPRPLDASKPITVTELQRKIESVDAQVVSDAQTLTGTYVPIYLLQHRVRYIG
jgi:hypothetical protein